MRNLKLKAILIVLIFAFSNAEEYHASFQESTRQLDNPDQGFYKCIYIVMDPNAPISIDKRGEGVLNHLRIDISKFSSKVNMEADLPINDESLKGLDNFFFELREANKNAIVRFAYDPGYVGNLNKEPSMETMKLHISQLSNILNKHSAEITAIEAGMLGPWGEMHTSDMSTDENKATIFRYWLRYTKEFPILGRTPQALFAYWGKTLDEMEKYIIPPTDAGYRLGIFNDCYLSSENDRGTYNDRPRETKWLSTINTHLPYGGEVCRVHVLNDLENAIPENRLLKLSYLNGGYEEQVTHEKWESQKYTSAIGNDSIYYDMNGRDYIERHFGHRLYMESLSVSYEISGAFSLTISLKNSGFGNLLKKKKVYLFFTKEDGTLIKYKFYGYYEGSSEIKINDKLLKDSSYKVYLKLCTLKTNNKFYYHLQFANDNVWSDSLKAHFLFNVKNGQIQS